MYQTSNPTAKEFCEPTTMDTKSQGATGFTTEKDLRRGYISNNPLEDLGRTTQNIQSVSGVYPLFTCQTGGTAFFYNEMSLFHIAERDLLSLIDYRKAVGETIQTTTDLAQTN